MHAILGGSWRGKYLLTTNKLWSYCKKTSQDASDARYGAVSVDYTAYDIARASSEVWLGEDYTPEKFISIMDLPPLGQIMKSKRTL